MCQSSNYNIEFHGLRLQPVVSVVGDGASVEQQSLSQAAMTTPQVLQQLQGQTIALTGDAQGGQQIYVVTDPAQLEVLQQFAAQQQQQQHKQQAAVVEALPQTIGAVGDSLEMGTQDSNGAEIDCSNGDAELESIKNSQDQQQRPLVVGTQSELTPPENSLLHSDQIVVTSTDYQLVVVPTGAQSIVTSCEESSTVSYAEWPSVLL